MTIVSIGMGLTKMSAAKLIFLLVVQDDTKVTYKYLKYTNIMLIKDNIVVHGIMAPLCCLRISPNLKQDLIHCRVCVSYRMLIF